MTKTADQLKNMIIDWCKQDGIDCQELPLKEDSPSSWQLVLGKPKVIVYIQKKFPDRIMFQNDIKFAEEHHKLINETWDMNKKQTMILNLQINGVSFNVHQEFLGDQNTMNGIRQYLIHSNPSFEKHDFLDKMMRLQEIHIVTLNVLSSTLGVAMNVMKQQEEAKDSKNPLTG